MLGTHMWTPVYQPVQYYLIMLAIKYKQALPIVSFSRSQSETFVSIIPRLSKRILGLHFMAFHHMAIGPLISFRAQFRSFHLGDFVHFPDPLIWDQS